MIQSLTTASVSIFRAIPEKERVVSIALKLGVVVLSSVSILELSSHYWKGRSIFIGPACRELLDLFLRTISYSSSFETGLREISENYDKDTIQKIRFASRWFSSELRLSGVDCSFWLDTMPNAMFYHLHLKNLELIDCNLSRIPEGVLMMNRLSTLDLSRNPLERIPDWIVKCTNLKTLRLAGCQLSSIPDGLGEMKQLECLDLSDNPDLESLPSSLTQLPNLKDIKTHGTKIPQQMVEEIIRLQPTDSNLYITTMTDRLFKWQNQGNWTEEEQLFEAFFEKLPTPLLPEFHQGMRSMLSTVLHCKEFRQIFFQRIRINSATPLLLELELESLYPISCFYGSSEEERPVIAERVAKTHTFLKEFRERFPDATHGDYLKAQATLRDRLQLLTLNQAESEDDEENWKELAQAVEENYSKQFEESII